MLREYSSGFSSNCDEDIYGGPKSFAQHVLGVFAQFDEHCLSLAETESSPVDEEEIKIKMDDGVAIGTSLASEGLKKKKNVLTWWDPE